MGKINIGPAPSKLHSWGKPAIVTWIYLTFYLMISTNNFGEMLQHDGAQ